MTTLAPDIAPTVTLPWEGGHNRASDASEASEPFSLRAIHAADALHDSAPKSLADFSRAADEAISLGLGENACWNYGRAVKGVEAKLGFRLPQSELRGVFNIWWWKAKPKLPEYADADEYFADFLDCYSRAKVPLGANVMAQATKAAQMDVREADKATYGERAAKLLAVCRALAALSPTGVFFISMRDAGKAMGTLDPYAPKKALNRLVMEGVLEITEKGTQGGTKASRYRFL